MSETPESTHEVWCRSCERNVVPADRGRCPHCNKWVSGNTARGLIHVGLRKDRLEAINDALAQDFLVETEPHRQRIAALARVLEMLERTRAGTTQFKRLTDSARDLEAQLEPTRNAQRGFYISAGELDSARSALQRKIDTLLWRLAGPLAKGVQ